MRTLRACRLLCGLWRYPSKLIAIFVVAVLALAIFDKLVALDALVKPIFLFVLSGRFFCGLRLCSGQKI